MLSVKTEAWKILSGVITSTGQSSRLGPFDPKQTRKEIFEALV